MLPHRVNGPLRKNNTAINPFQIEGYMKEIQDELIAREAHKM